MTLLRGFLGMIAGLIVCGAVRADTWLPPKSERYYSPSRQVELTVVPHVVSPIDYFAEKAEEAREGRTQDRPRKSAKGVLRKRTNGGWSVVWQGPLANEVSPVSALVADTGRFVTFDNWHHVGIGSDVVVVYDAAGNQVRSLGLRDLVPAEWITALPRSVSSVQWAGEHRLSADGSQVVLNVIVPTGAGSPAQARYIEIGVDLASGSVERRTDAAWQQAVEQASRAADARRAEQAADLVARATPLLRPATAGERDWHLYLTEAFYRLDPDWKEKGPDVQVLRSPKARDYKASERWLREALLDDELPVDVLMIASPAAPDHLIAVLTKLAHNIKPGALAQARIYVSGPTSITKQAADLLLSSGAQVIGLNPLLPIPQRKERLPSAR